MKIKTLFYCTQCGNETPKWQGQCSACGSWNTIVEQPSQGKSKSRGTASKSMVGSISLRKPKLVSEMDIAQEIRFATGLAELDRVLGGGAVKGSLVLIGGAPGIGKSTLMLQICDQLCRFAKVLYVSGEESERQLKLRAERLGVSSEELFILSETRMSEVLAAVESVKPDILIADSIQTLYNEANESSPGSVSQVKDCTMSLMTVSKQEGLTVFVVGHINKDGNLVIEMEKKNCGCKGKGEEKKDCKYLRKEFSYSKFSQTLLLPDNADKDAIEAHVNNGILYVMIPKTTKEKVEEGKKVIEVK